MHIIVLPHAITACWLKLVKFGSTKNELDMDKGVGWLYYIPSWETEHVVYKQFVESKEHFIDSVMWTHFLCV